MTQTAIPSTYWEEELRDEKEMKNIISPPPVYCKLKDEIEKSIANADTATERAAQEKWLAPVQTP